MSATEWIDTYGIHHWSILRSSYRQLAWVGFQPTITEFRSDALTDWAIRPWVQLALRANFVQLLKFHLFVQYSRSILAIAFVSRHIFFKRNVAQVITWVQRNIYIIYCSRIYIIYYNKIIISNIICYLSRNLWMASLLPSWKASNHNTHSKQQIVYKYV